MECFGYFSRERYLSEIRSQHLRNADVILPQKIIKLYQNPLTINCQLKSWYDRLLSKLHGIDQFCFVYTQT